MSRPSDQGQAMHKAHFRSPVLSSIAEPVELLWRGTRHITFDYVGYFTHMYLLWNNGSGK
jgi:hypothetical protein